MNQRLAKLWQRWRRTRDFAIAQGAFAALGLLRLLPPRTAIDGAARLGRLVGPRTRFHARALENLRRAFPEKDEDWVRRIACDHWGEMARLGAEYVFLDAIVDTDPTGTGEGLLEFGGADLFEDLRDRQGPFIFFTGHCGPFELLPVGAATFGLEITALFRPPRNRYLAKRLLAARRTRGGHLVPSRAGATWALMQQLREGRSVGVLVDQRLEFGVRTRFFGRKCKTNPLLPKLARQFGCEVYPARSIRLPNGRYRLELQPRLELPGDARGGVDVAATCQLLNDVVEGWVREHPEQWTWFYRRW